jgi:hypothetical protein
MEKFYPRTVRGELGKLAKFVKERIRHPGKTMKFFLVILTAVVCLAAIWLGMDEGARNCMIYGTNICNYYAVMKMEASPANFAAMMALCGGMTDVPKKDGCFELIAMKFAPADPKRANTACGRIRGFDGVHSKNGCYDMIEELSDAI